MSRPGCNGTSVEIFAGAVCPEYDMVLNQMALLYGNHFDEARRVVDWLGRALPRAERYAREGLTLHKVSMKYSGGAKFASPDGLRRHDRHPADGRRRDMGP